MVFAALLLGFILMASMLLAYTPADTFYILGVQGRYFLPFLPVLLLAFRTPRLQRLRAIGRVGIELDALLLSGMMLMDALVLLSCFLTVVQRA